MPQQLANFKAEFFKALAHPIRIRIIDCLRNGEKGVNELSDILRIEPANVSQQLAILRVRNIVIGRKAGSNVYYSVSDTTLFRLLDVARQIFNNHLVGVRNMLQQKEKTPKERLTPTNCKGRSVFLFLSTSALLTCGRSVGAQRQNRFARGLRLRGRTLACTHERTEGLEVWPREVDLKPACGVFGCRV